MLLIISSWLNLYSSLSKYAWLIIVPVPQQGSITIPSLSSMVSLTNKSANFLGVANCPATFRFADTIED